MPLVFLGCSDGTRSVPTTLKSRRPKGGPPTRRPHGEGEAEAEGEEEGEEEGGDEDDEEAPKKKKKKAPKPKKAPAPKRTRAAKKAVRQKAIWVIYDNSSKEVETFPFSQKSAAEKFVAEKADDKKGYYLQMRKVPMEEK